MEIFVDPRMSRMLLDTVRVGRITVKELCDRNPDVPRSTMYRLLTKMERAGLLEVVDYRQKRGTVEKTYALRKGALPGADGVPKEDITYPEMADMFLVFCIEFANRFRTYAESNPGKVGIGGTMGYWTAPVRGTEGEIRRLTEEIGRLVTGFESRGAEEERRLHSIGLILSPPSEGSSEQHRDRSAERFRVAGGYQDARPPAGDADLHAPVVAGCDVADPAEPQPDPPSAVLAHGADPVADLDPLDVLLRDEAGPDRPYADAPVGDGHIHPQEQGQHVDGYYDDGHDAETGGVRPPSDVDVPAVGQDGCDLDDQHQQRDRGRADGLQHALRLMVECRAHVRRESGPYFSMSMEERRFPGIGIILISRIPYAGSKIGMAPRERFELPRITPAVFETAAIPGLATSAWTSRLPHDI